MPAMTPRIKPTLPPLKSGKTRMELYRTHGGMASGDLSNLDALEDGGADASFLETEMQIAELRQRLRETRKSI